MDAVVLVVIAVLSARSAWRVLRVGQVKVLRAQLRAP